MQITTTIAGIIEAIKTQLSMTNVYNHVPLMNTGLLLKEQASENGIIHACIVTRPTANLDLDSSENTNEWRHQIIIELRRTYEGAASQTAHDNEVDALLDIFSDGSIPCGSCGKCGSMGSLRLTPNGPFLWFPILVHYARIELGVDVLS
jgi:hypothetical protein